MIVYCAFTIYAKTPTEEEKKLLEDKFSPRYIDWNNKYEKRMFAADADEWLKRGKNYAVMTKTSHE